MRQTFASIHTILAWLVFAGANIEFILIGMSVFGVASTEVHAWGGRVLILLALLLVIAALLSRTSGLTVGLSLLVLMLLMPGQGILAYTDFPTRALNALHALNGLLILWTAYALAHGRARATMPAEEQAAAAVTVATEHPSSA